MIKDWLRFELKHKSESGKTDIYKVINNIFTQDIGKIQWYTPWRKYVFWPNAGFIFDSRCMRQLCEFLDTINEAHKKKPPASEAEPGGKISPYTTVTEEKIVKQEEP